MFPAPGDAALACVKMILFLKSQLSFLNRGQSEGLTSLRSLSHLQGPCRGRPALCPGFQPKRGSSTSSLTGVAVQQPSTTALAPAASAICSLLWKRLSSCSPHPTVLSDHQRALEKHRSLPHLFKAHLQQRILERDGVARVGGPPLGGSL